MRLSRRDVFVAAAAAGLTGRLGRAAAALPRDRTYTVAFAQDTAANDWRVAQVRAVAAELAKYPSIRFRHTEANGRMAQQILDIEELVAERIDVLITSPLDPVAMAPVIAGVEAKGVPVILLSRRIEGDGFTSFITADNYEIGRRACQFLARRLHGQGRILVLQHIPTTTPAIGRTNGFMDELKNHPGLTVAAMHRADSLRAKAIQVVDEALAGGLAFDAIYAQSDSMASGARLALKRAGIEPSAKPTIGIDYIQESREAILAGEQEASFTYPTFGREGAQLAVRLLEGQSVPKFLTVESMLVTRDNAASVDPIF